MDKKLWSVTYEGISAPEGLYADAYNEAKALGVDFEEHVKSIRNQYHEQSVKNREYHMYFRNREYEIIGEVKSLLNEEGRKYEIVIIPYTEEAILEMVGQYTIASRGGMRVTIEPIQERV